MSSIVACYLSAIEKKLICNRKRKKVLMQQLVADIGDFSDERGETLTVKDLEQRFGTASEVAESLLKQIGMPEISRLVSKKKTVITIVAVACFIAIILLSAFIWHRAKLQEDIAGGYSVEILYDHTISSPPPIEEDARVYGDFIES